LGTPFHDLKRGIGDMGNSVCSCTDVRELSVDNQPEYLKEDDESVAMLHDILSGVIVPESPEHQRKLILQLEEASIFQPSLNLPCYALPTEWLQSWEAYTTASASDESRIVQPPPPTAIFNQSIIVPSTMQLIPSLVIGEDVSFVSYPKFKCLQKWYDGGPEIPRCYVRKHDSNNEILEVEAFPVTVVYGIQATEARSFKPKFSCLKSRTVTLQDVLNYVCGALGTDFTHSTCWIVAYDSRMLFSAIPQFLLSNRRVIPSTSMLRSTLEELGVTKFQVLEIEVSQKLECVVEESISEQCSESLCELQVIPGVVSMTDQKSRGAVSSIVQCLSHISALRDYFMMDPQRMISRSSVVYDSSLAFAFAKVLKDIWRSSTLPDIEDEKSLEFPPLSCQVFLQRFMKRHPHLFNSSSQDVFKLLEVCLETLDSELNSLSMRPNLDFVCDEKVRSEHSMSF
jgi:hypothetical protein